MVRESCGRALVTLILFCCGKSGEGVLMREIVFASLFIALVGSRTVIIALWAPAVAIELGEVARLVCSIFTQLPN